MKLGEAGLGSNVLRSSGERFLIGNSKIEATASHRESGKPRPTNRTTEGGKLICRASLLLSHVIKAPPWPRKVNEKEKNEKIEGKKRQQCHIPSRVKTFDRTNWRIWGTKVSQNEGENLGEDCRTTD